MRACRVIIAVLALLPAGAESRADPKAVSIHPFTGQRGTTFSVTVRGSGLAGATAVSIGKAPFKASVEAVSSEDDGKKTRTDVVKVRLEVPQDANPGRYPIRLITRDGISN